MQKLQENLNYLYAVMLPPKVARQCQTFKRTSLHKFGPPKILFGMIFFFFYLSHGLSVEFFSQLLANLIKITNHYELQIDWSKNQKNQNPHLFLWSYIFF